MPRTRVDYDYEIAARVLDSVRIVKGVNPSIYRLVVDDLDQPVWCRGYWRRRERSRRRDGFGRAFCYTVQRAVVPARNLVTSPISGA